MSECQACMAIRAASRSPNDKLRCAETATMVCLSLVSVLPLNRIVRELCERHLALYQRLLDSPALTMLDAVEKKARD